MNCHCERMNIPLTKMDSVLLIMYMGMNNSFTHELLSLWEDEHTAKKKSDTWQQWVNHFCYTVVRVGSGQLYAHHDVPSKANFCLFQYLCEICHCEEIIIFQEWGSQPLVLFQHEGIIKNMNHIFMFLQNNKSLTSLKFTKWRIQDLQFSKKKMFKCSISLSGHYVQEKDELR